MRRNKASSANLNHHGCKLLHNGLTDQADEAFRAAMKLMANHIGSDRGSSVVAYPNLTSDEHENESLATRRVWKANVPQGWAIKEGGSFVYINAFGLSPEPKASNQTSNTQVDEQGEGHYCVVRDAAIIMYNLALVKQLKAMSKREAKDQALEMGKSLHLYNLVYTIVTSQRNGDILTDPYFRLVVMATFNNMADALFHLGDFAGSEACVEQLEHLLVDFATSIESYSGWIEPNDLELFQSTLLFRRAPTNAAAA